MIKALFLLFEPGAAWEHIAQARRGISYILATYLLPILLLTTAVEAWGLQHWGKWQPKFKMFKDFSPQAIVSYEVVLTLLLLIMVFVCALILLRISQTFHGRHTYLQAFTIVSYGFCPVFLLRLLDAAPQISPWVTWAIGIALVIRVLYQGVPRVMEPDPTHAFGLYLSALVVIILMSGVVRLLTGLYLLGYLDLQHSWLTRQFSTFLK
jgi:hypothetical protein